jgi:linoleoyl-CoA desaturase
MKLHYPKEDSNFVLELKQAVAQEVQKVNLKNYTRYLWLKLILFLVIFFGAFYDLLFFQHQHFFGLFLNYFIIGWIGVLLAFNSSHDAIHGAFSKHKWINNLIFSVTFNLQGTSAFLWGMQHKASHHIFPNVDGCDVDIDENIFVRLSPTKPLHWWYKYQHIYATFLYSLYTLQWIFLKDFAFLFQKDFANLKNLQYKTSEIAGIIIWKLIYIGGMLVLPIMFTSYGTLQIILAFVSMHFCISLFFVFTAILSHLCEFTDFPQPDSNGALPYGYYRHQLEVCMDYSPQSKILNFLLGGSNTHAAHHLFPKLPHTIYGKITPIISSIAAKYNYGYHALPYHKAIWSHYKFLKKMGNG